MATSSDALVVLPRQWAQSPMFRGVVEPIPVRAPIAAPDIVRVTRAGLPLTPLAERWSDLLRRQAGGEIALSSR